MSPPWKELSWWVLTSPAASTCSHARIRFPAPAPYPCGAGEIMARKTGRAWRGWLCRAVPSPRHCRIGLIPAGLPGLETSLGNWMR